MTRATLESIGFQTRDVMQAMARDSRISPAVKFRNTPSSPLAQNTHPIAQPTWLLTQIVRRLSSRNNTHSIKPPSDNFNNNFSVPSSAVECVAIVLVNVVNELANSSRKGCGRLVIAEKSLTRFSRIQSIICGPRNPGCSRRASQSLSFGK